MGKKSINENTTVVDMRKKPSLFGFKKKPAAEKVTAVKTPATESAPNIAAQTGSFTKDKEKKPLTQRSRLLIAVGLVAFILLIGYASFKVIDNRNKSKYLDCKKQICKQVLTNAYTAFGAQDVEAQKKVVDQILSYKNFDKQPNYDWVLTQYYVNVSDTPNAQKYHDKLKDVYNADGYSEIIRPIAKTPEDMQAEIDFLNNQSGNASGLDKAMHQ